jgi:hypothetical protein
MGWGFRNEMERLPCIDDVESAHKNAYNVSDPSTIRQAFVRVVDRAQAP